MQKSVDWDARIGRRVRLRELHILLIVVQSGSMAKAAEHLGISQPAVSEAIADLEAALNVRLLDRSRRGVEPTAYGGALLKYGRAAFDELRQGIKEIEFLSDPTAGEIRLGCSETITSSLLPPVIERLSERYPRMSLKVTQVSAPTIACPELHDRTLDLVLARLATADTKEFLAAGYVTQILFNDRFCIVAGAQSRWARRRKIDLAELVDEPWIMTPLDSPGGRSVVEAFHARGLDMPRITVTTHSVHLRNDLVNSGRFITALPASVVHHNAKFFSLQILPIQLSLQPWPVAAVTLKNRTTSPVVRLFIECVREVAKSIFTRPQSRKPAAT
jgi:DNA-binding transcriptional LysR family regulator